MMGWKAGKQYHDYDLLVLAIPAHTLYLTYLIRHVLASTIMITAW